MTDEKEKDLYKCQRCNKEYSVKDLRRSVGDALWTSLYCSPQCYTKAANKMEKPKTYYVAVKPSGEIMGPVSLDREFVKQSLVIGYGRAVQIYKKVTADQMANEVLLEGIWNAIKKMGYRIAECEIILKEK